MSENIVSDFYTKMSDSVEKSNSETFPGPFIKTLKDVIIGTDDMEPFKNKKFALFPLPQNIIEKSSHLVTIYTLIYEDGTYYGNISKEEIERFKKLK